MKQGAGDFTFGLETEFLLVDLQTYEPLWYPDLSFVQLNSLLESISLEGIPSLRLLDLEPPHKKLMPYVVEGYHVSNDAGEVVGLLPKGVEIRTPVCQSIKQCLEIHQILFDRLQAALEKESMLAVALSHHPQAEKFWGPQGKRRRDYWNWAMEAMLTYGPDINVGIPPSLVAHFNLEDFERKVNYYAAAMSGFSLASPFERGGLWTEHGQYGKSFRTHRRSTVAPPIEFHPDEENRLEFKVFDMSPSLQDYENFFLLLLALILDDRLKGRASTASRIYDQGRVALEGWEAHGIHERALELLDSARDILPSWGFNPAPLYQFRERLEKHWTPADALISMFREGNSLRTVFKYCSRLYSF